jgi:hypothetical protein
VRLGSLRGELGYRCRQGESAPLGVRTTSSREIQVCCIVRGADPAGVVKQRVEVGQREPTAEEDHGKEQGVGAPTAAPEHRGL